MVKLYKRQDRCVLCETQNLEQVLNLGNTPIANKLESNPLIQKKNTFFPLRLGMCQACSHLQILDIIDERILFSNYPYLSKSNSSTEKRFIELSETLYKKYCQLKPDSKETPFIIEIGSNDGFLLKQFQGKSCTVLGIDPSENATKNAVDSGVRTITDFFSYKLARKLKRNYPTPTLIIANNVLAHSDDLIGIFKGIRLLMGHETVLIVEFSYALDILEKLLIDTIYHEHMSYHSIIPLNRFLHSIGLRIFNVERFDAHGGSARVSVCLNDSVFEEDSSVELLILKERSARLHDVDSWRKVRHRIESLKDSISNEISKLINLGFQVSGYGVPAKFSTLFHSLELSEKDFTHIYDDNQSKVGNYAPGTNLLIEPSSNLNLTAPCYLLIFSWNYSDEIMEKLRRDFPKVKGALIPLPKFSLVHF